MSTLKFAFLGPAQFQVDEQAIDLTSAKAVALLAYLAVNDGRQSREHLTTLLWPDSHPDAARKNLRNTLWAIRKALGDEALETEGDHLSLPAPVEVDLRRFETTAAALHNPAPPAPEALETALALYRGPLLAGLSLTDAPDFELWLSTEQERLGQLYLRLLEALITQQKQQGDWPAVIATAHRALSHDNLQEPVYRSLMEAHARRGDRAEALRQYDSLRKILAHELGVEPLPETETLRAAILQGELQPAPPPPPAVPSAAPPARPARSRPPATPFVGRRAEQATLGEALRQAGAGQVRVALITGELGIGKSRLWQEWSSRLGSEVTLLETRCLDTTQSLPFAPLTGLFGQAACIEQLLQATPPLSPLWLAELSRLMPEIRQAGLDIPTPPTLPPEEERRRLFEAFTQILRRLNGRTLVLFIDDLHWVDQATLDWLVYLVDRMREAPLLLVGAYRSSEASARLIQRVTGWSRAGVVERLPLRRFTLEEAQALIKALDGDPDQTKTLQAKSAGNPYFLIELNRAGPDNAPPGLSELIQARLEPLSETARQVLQAAAVLEAGFGFSLLRRTSGRGEEETLNALDELLAAEVLLERETGYEFSHPLVAAVVGEQLSLARRSFLHRRAAEALETIHAGRLEAAAGQLATHYAQAGRPEQAAHYAQLAADRAMSLAAPAEAITFYRQALRLSPSPQVHLRLGQALYLQGELNAAREAFQQAAETFKADDQTAALAEAYLALAGSYLPSGQGEMVSHWARAALQAAQDALSPEIEASAYHLLGAGALLVGRSLAQAEQNLKRAIELATEKGLNAIAGRGWLDLGNLLAQRGELPAALDAYRHTLRLAEADGDRLQAVLGHNNLAYHYLLAGDRAAARRHLEQGLALTETHAFFLPRMYLYSTQGEIALAEEKLAEAEAAFAQALAEAERQENQVQAANIRANMGLAARQKGDDEEALLLLTEARGALATFTTPHLQTQIDLWLAELHHQRGERVVAAEALARAELRLAGSERKGLEEWAARVRASLEEK